MYQLYFQKDECIIQIKKLSKVFNDQIPKITEEIFYYNNCYYFCKNRAVLKTKAEEMKQGWLTETQERLDKVMNIKI